MARRVLVRCMACGSRRLPEAFGIGIDTVPDYEAFLAIQTIGGRGRCSWVLENLPHDMALELRECLRAALARLDADLGIE